MRARRSRTSGCSPAQRTSATAYTHDGADKITGISVFERGAWVRRDAVRAGEIGKLWGLTQVKVGEPIGARSSDAQPHHFAPPTLEARVAPDRHEDHVALRAALAQLVEQDPLINVRAEDSGELAVSLYGEVQKEVIEATLAADYGIAVSFRETTPLYIERPAGTGEAEEILNTPDNPFHATIGLRIQPAAAGITFRLAVDYQSVPLYVYRNIDEFANAMEQYVRDVLQEGLYGWSVTDCEVTMFSSSYSVADGPPSRRGPTSTAADFRKLTPLVLMQALQRAGTRVCEPISRVRIDAPSTSMGSILGALAPVEPRSTRRPYAVTTSASRPTCRPRRCRHCIARCRRSRTATVCWSRRSPAINRCVANRRYGGVRPRIR